MQPNGFDWIHLVNLLWSAHNERAMSRLAFASK
jgi:hypothetical protein